MIVDRSVLSDKFIELFVKTLKLSDRDFDLLLSRFTLEVVPPKHLFVKAGQVSRQKAYINRGSARTYTVDARGREHILFFSFEDWWIADMASYYTQLPGIQNIQTLEECELLCVSKPDLDFLCQQLPMIEELFEQKRQRMTFATLNNLNDVKSLSAEERYLNLIEKHPFIFQRVPLHYIASFLDIEAPSLSRLRSRLSKKCQG